MTELFKLIPSLGWYKSEPVKRFVERSFVILFQTTKNRRLKLVALVFSMALVSQFLLASLLFVVPSTAQAAASQAPASAIPNTDVDPYGVNTFLDKEVEYWKKDRTMQMISQAGIKWIKQIFAWNEIEFKKGYYNDDKNQKSGWQKYDEIVDLANKYGIQIVARVDQTPAWANPVGGTPGGHPANYQDYADFLKAFVQHYKGKVNYITVWNEPNLEREWEPTKKVNPAAYVDMLKLAYQAIKSVDPNVKVMAAPLAITLEEDINMSELSYLDGMYKAGAKDYFDIMPANAYGLAYPPDAAPDPKVLNYRRVELLHNVMVQNGDTNKAVWFNEYGWNASPGSIPDDKLTWGRVTEQQQAQWTVEGIDYAKKNWPWSGVIFIWYFRQVGDVPDDSSEQYFQMVTKDFVEKPVYDSVKTSAINYLKANNQATPVSGTPIVPITSTPVPGVPTPTVPPTVTLAPTIGDNGGTQTTTGGTQTANGTPGTTVGSAGSTATVAAQAGPTATPAQPRATSTPTPPGGAVTNPTSSDSGSVVPIIIGVVLVIAAGGGLAAWFFTQRRRP
ncbi:MAG: hypothetical protein BGO39_21885 [Chloroflexi bacterium 54-19]|nr:MAG: hypothetical protein BGO39_21885 [Chloroflexi bacterium 54-19]